MVLLTTQASSLCFDRKRMIPLAKLSNNTLRYGEAFGLTPHSSVGIREIIEVGKLVPVSQFLAGRTERRPRDGAGPVIGDRFSASGADAVGAGVHSAQGFCGLTRHRLKH